MASPLTPELHRDLTIRAKKQIRSRMKALRSCHPKSSQAKRSALIVQQLLLRPEMQRAKRVASFWPLIELGEVDLRPLDTALREKGVELYYPFMDPGVNGSFITGFRKLPSTDELQDRGRGFLEPHPALPVASADEIDIILVPALAADSSGQRIGYGAGYYDVTLQEFCPPAKSWIVVHHYQYVSELPREGHDILCDGVVTDKLFITASTQES